MAEKIMRKIKQKKDDGTWAEYKIGADAEDVIVTLNDKKTNINEILQNLSSDSRKPKEILESWDVINTILTTGGHLGYFKIGDYLSFLNLFPNEDVKFYIIGVDTHTGTFKKDGTQVGHHIDFCGYSYQKLMKALQYPLGSPLWTDASNNNSVLIDGELKTAYENSYVNTQLNAKINQLKIQMAKGYGTSGQGGGTLYPNFAEKTMILDTRYSEDGTVLSSSNGKTTYSTPLWCLTEYEMLGNCIKSSSSYASGMAIQYPFFNNPDNRKLILDGLIGQYKSCVFPNAAEGSDVNLASYNLSTGCNQVSSQGVSWGDFPICFRLEAGFKPDTTIQ